MTGILNALLGFLKPAGGPFTVIQTFTSSTSWVAPEGVTEVEYLIVGGGGSGGAKRRRRGCRWVSYRNWTNSNRRKQHIRLLLVRGGTAASGGATGGSEWK
jgi:hypothetical protein